MSVLNPVAPVLARYYAVAGPAVEEIKVYGLNIDEIIAHCGSIARMNCRFDGKGYFHIHDAGEPAIVFEVYDEDDSTTIDLCAFPIANPEIFSTAVGAAVVLGYARVINPATWAFEGMLAVHRTPLGWLKGGCQGVCILDHRVAPYALGEALGPLLAEDEAHARTLKRMLCRPPVNPANILFPISARAAA